MGYFYLLHVTLHDHAPFRDDFIGRVRLAMLNLQTKFKVSIGAPSTMLLNGIAKCRKWGSLGARKVMGNVTNRQSAYDFIFNCNRNYSAIL